MTGTRITLFLFLITIAATIAACGTSTGPASTTVTAPAPGSTFVFHYYQLDSKGAAIAEGAGYDTVSVVATGTSYVSKTNVTHFHLSTGADWYYNYETNGDFSIYHSAGSDPHKRAGWITLPIASKTLQRFVDADTTQIDGTHWQDSMYVSYHADESISLANHSFHAVVINVLQNTTAGVYGTNGTLWLSPEIGLEIEDDYPWGQLTTANVFYGSHRELVAYTLK